MVMQLCTRSKVPLLDFPGSSRHHAQNAAAHIRTSDPTAVALWARSALHHMGHFKPPRLVSIGETFNTLRRAVRAGDLNAALKARNAFANTLRHVKPDPWKTFMEEMDYLDPASRSSEALERSGTALIDPIGLVPELDALAPADCVFKADLWAQYLDLGDAVNESLSSLTPREEMVIRLRFGIPLAAGIESVGLTCQEVGVLMNLVRQRVFQIESQAIRKLSMAHRSHRLSQYHQDLRPAHGTRLRLETAREAAFLRAQVAFVEADPSDTRRPRLALLLLLLGLDKFADLHATLKAEPEAAVHRIAASLF
jgi:hypothetical protein